MENLRPLGYIRERPFPELNLTIDRQPVRIADTQSFDEDVDPATVSLATAIATTLWLWHPNALRAFLDFEKFSKVEWNLRNVGERAYNTCVINRDDRIVLAGFYNRDISWSGQCTVEIEPSGAWTPIGAILYDESLKRPGAIKQSHRNMAGQIFYHKAWQSIHPDLRHEFYATERGEISFGLKPSNPHIIYLSREVDFCEQCGKQSQELEANEKLKYCLGCHNTLYCSKDCQKKDWVVHKHTCSQRSGSIKSSQRGATKPANG